VSKPTTREYSMMCTRMGHTFYSHLVEESPHNPSYKNLPECPKCSGTAYPVTAFNWPLFIESLVRKNHQLELDIMDLQARGDYSG
jgi:hypothetical protein